MSTEAEILKPSQFPLWGSRLIEASAGTGKTYTIAALYVRLILGHGQDNGPPRPLGPKDILVMTFTKAATQELTTRIQQRLSQAAQIFRGQIQADPKDQFVIELLQDYPTQGEKDNAAWLLNEAAQCMDDACIYTIDAWCQRVLKEYAVYSGQPFDEELVSHQEQLRKQALEDFWRQSVYPLSPDHALMLKRIWPNEIDDLERLIDDHAFDLENNLIDDVQENDESMEIIDLDAHWTEMLAARAMKLKPLKQDALVCIETLRPWIDSLSNSPTQLWNLRSLVKSSLLKWIGAIEVWCKDADQLDIDLDPKKWRRISLDSIRESLLEPQTVIVYPKELLHFEEIGRKVFSIPTIKQEIQDYCLNAVKHKIKIIKKQNSTFGFADLLMRLNARLHQGHANVLKGLIKKQYPVILIDEFQDTSSLQYSIFNTIYEIGQNDRNHLICLIADPKQSIYAFRGADISSYMLAKQSTSPRHYYLDQNFRSTTALVNSVNRWFGFAQTNAPWGAFLYKRDNKDDLPFHPVQANGLDSWIVQTQNNIVSRMPSVSMVCDFVPKNAQSIHEKFAALCAEKIVAWLNDDTMSYLKGAEDSPAGKKQRIKPADIAVLVRTTKESVAVRQALSLRGVASVYLSDKDSVFDTTEARDLIFWLDAVANPRNADKMRAGLATSTMGFELQEIKAIGQDEAVFDHYSEIISDLNHVWQHSGVLAMLRSTLHRLSLPKRWLKIPEGERRLTNYLHLSELLQMASLNQMGTQSLVNWLSSAIHEKTFQTDEHILRLESDADLVKVITIHKSKGLEFPIVCLPFPTLFNSKAGKKEKISPFIDPSSSEQEDVDEELRESMRLFYVALTRAKYALWLGFALYKEGSGNKDLTYRSALGYLLGSTSVELNPVEWENRVNVFFKDVIETGTEECTFLSKKSDSLPGGNDTGDALNPGNDLPVESLGINRLQVHANSMTLRPHVTYAAHFERDFKIHSFSSLLRNTPIPSIAVGIMGGVIANDDELQAWEEDENNLTSGLKRIANSTLKPKDIDPPSPLKNAMPAWRDLPGGMKVGTFIHDTLQWMIQEGLESLDNDDGAARLLQKIEMTLPGKLTTDRSGLVDVAEQVVLNESNQVLCATFADWFKAIAATNIEPLGTSLKKISTHLCEMEFWLSVEYFHAHRVEQICRQFIFPNLERPVLTPQSWHGLMMGFADLVFEHEGRFWLMDYKSNYLGLEEDSYSRENIERDVVKNRYDLQMAIYLVALHRILKSRLGAQYHVNRHLGGAMLWYLRGVDSPSQGICFIPCGVEMMESLDGIISGDFGLPSRTLDASNARSDTTHD